jgi:hypothetical protein
MNILTGFTDSPRQTTTIVLEDGGRVTLAIEYRPQQLGWFYDLEYDTFLLQGQRLVSGSNIIRQFMGQIPFGLSVLTQSYLDPSGQEDFVSGEAVIVLLDQADVQAIELLKFTRDD